MTHASPDDESSSAHSAAARTDRETTYHPALTSPSGRGMPAGKVLIVVLVGLLVAGLLNSAWMVRTAAGMKPGLGRTIVTAVSTPVHAVATALSLDRPRKSLDLLLGRELVDDSSGEIEVETVTLNDTEDSATLVASGAAPAPPHVAPATVTKPTVAKPLKVLVLGDSLSTYTGQRLADILTEKKLAKATVEYRNGVGLATPQFFNWPKWALARIDEAKPDVVVVIIGGNDHQDMQRKDEYFVVGTPEWQKEYQRRVQVVMQSMIAHGADRVYWSGPPTAKEAADSAAYHQLNLAAQAAAKTVPGGRFIDLAGPTSLKGEWLDTLVFGNEAFPARMDDGLHWSWRASQITARLVAAGMAREYGPLL